MNPYSRHVSFAGEHVAITATEPAAIAVIDHLFTDVSNPLRISPHYFFRILFKNNRWFLEKTNAPSGSEHEWNLVFEGESIGDLASALVGEVLYHLTDVCDSGLVFHAAAVTKNGNTVALPAESGSGKTTLAAWLVTQGWQYLTDELVYVPLGSEQLHAFTRPLNFKRAGFSFIKDVFGIDTNANYALTGHYTSLVPHRQLRNSQADDRVCQLSHCVFPTYTDGHTGELQPLSSARAGLALMNCLVNARNLPEHGFTQVTRLVKKTRNFAFNYGNFESAEELLLPALTTRLQ